ncbi:hypothetical protein, conserved [Entamoeba dispar SAW760]|uniref:Ubiquitin carboxyl-terminal hydrolase n=1 Tax=Entamoeba dispar (strain ATCC PRA-260 / SAW760) TaxID=370354 RepID=B0EKD2_ENTDS|nr:uncharacterized protein EDI_193460 [Entamoeba dispar SAW760]EDR25019.1 hypothetical protein, conserved [Entamoeba dispar SAW760]|eukprot:EDR25019.1 hypothetical protein, conserved [Entamoeba dispar SAW760]
MTRYLKRILSSCDDHSRSPHPIEGGTCGLYNLGNTCYLNSPLQCLAHCDIIQSFAYQFPTPFVKNLKPGDKTVYDNNTKIALAFFSVVKALWSNDYVIVTPKALKDLISDKYEQFRGHNQQDAQEFTLVLLEELNMDLLRNNTNEIIVGTPTRIKLEKTPSEFADCIWNKYLQENNSIITHTFSGQQQQKITCCECGYSSESFDPFNCISLTIPSIGRQRGFVPLIIVGKQGKPILCKVLVNVSVDVNEIKSQIPKAIGNQEINICINQLAFYVLQKNGKGKKRLINEGKLSLINYDKIVGYEIDSSKEIKVTIFIRVIKNENVVVLHNIPFLICTEHCTIKELKRKIEKRMEWMKMGNSRICIVDEEGKQCKLCGERIGCTGCSLKEDMKLEELITKTKELYVSYDCEEKGIIDEQIICESYKITNNQRLQTTAVSIFACLTLFTHGDSFETIDWYCDSCKKSVKAEVDVTIWRPPQVLIFQLKRFEFTEKYEQIKTYERVVFPPFKFDLKEYVSNPSFKEPILYDLFGIVNHQGKIDKGHYYADCKVDTDWYRFDDEKVTKLEEVPTGSDDAYVLYYRLIE